MNTNQVGHVDGEMGGLLVSNALWQKEHHGERDEQLEEVDEEVVREHEKQG